MALLMGIDVGTSSLKVIVIDEAGEVQALAGQDYQYGTPQPGYAEQEPEVWWQACLRAIAKALQQGNIPGDTINAIGFSGQMHGAVMLDKNMNSVRPAILHCDARSADQVAQLRRQVAEKQLEHLMMNPVYTGFMLPSLLWVQQNEPQNFAKIRHVCLPKDYLKLRLCGQLSTDFSDASATLGFDIRQQAWSPDLLALADLPQSLFPSCYETFCDVGRVSASAAAETGLSTRTVITAGGADAVMQGIGNGATSLQVVTANIGSSGQVCFQSDAPVFNPQLTTNTFCGYKKDRFITMGAIMHAGLSLKWFGSLFEAVDYRQLDVEAQQAGPGSGGLLFLPYLNGERTPHMDPDLSGLFLGCQTGTSRGAMARAVMEGVAFALAQCMEVCNELGLTAQSAVASGGGSHSPLWLQIQADVYGIPLQVAQISQQAALGAAITAGVGAGVFDTVEQATTDIVRYRPGVVEPSTAAHDVYRQYYHLYKEAYAANRDLLRQVTRLGRSQSSSTAKG